MSQQISSFSITDIYGNSKQIGTLADLDRFISSEKEGWAWLNGSGVGEYQARAQSNFSRIDQFIEQFRSGTINEGQLVGNVCAFYNTANPPMHFSDFSPGNVVEMIFKTHGTEDAKRALDLLTGNVNLAIADFRQMRVWSMLVTPTAIGADAWASEERKKLSSARDAMRRAVLEAGQRLESELDRMRGEEAKARKDHWRRTGLALRAGVRRARSVKTSAKSSIESIERTEATYKEKMGLLAPVEYWKNKRTRHRNGARWWGGAFAAYLVAAVIVGACLFQLAWEHSSGDGFTGRHFLVAAGIGTVLTMLIWLARILMRIFLGELHLYTDAEERRIMTETYLALIKENGASDNERALILATLFRSAQDGIVKEDVGGEIGIFALAAKAMDPKRPQ